MADGAKKLAIYFGALTLLVAALVLGTNFALKLIPATPPPAQTPLPLPKADIRIEHPGGGPPAGGGRVEIVEPGPADTRPVTYREDGFTPAEITIRASDPLGCVITVINRSSSPLRVGVSPHDPAGDPGANYGSIAQGETGILDVRYPGRQEITLHSHDQPEHAFLVRYGEGC